MTESHSNDSQPRSSSTGTVPEVELSPASPPPPVLRVTCTDLVTGDSQTAEIPAGEYLLLTTEPCHVAHTQAFPAKGTHVVTIKGRTAP